MRLPGSNNTKPPELRPDISAPLPGSARPIPRSSDGKVPPNPMPIDRTGIPENEYPHNRPVPNNLVMRNAQGGVELMRLMPGSRLAEPMPMAQPDRSGLVHIDSVSWPANNHATDKLHSLKNAHTQSLNDLNTAKMNAAGAPGMSPQELRRHRKAGTAQIHDLERAERHARRSVDVYKSRFSRELGTEAEFRMAKAADAKRNWHPPVPSGRPEVPVSVPLRPGAPAKSKAPELPTIKERGDSPESLHLPPGVKVSDGVMDSAPSKLGPHQQRFAQLSDEYRSAKNEYHGMKPESSRYSREDMALARRTYKDADHAVRSYMKSNRNELDRERQGLPLPEPKGLTGVEREGLRLALREQGREYDRFPEFPTAGTPHGSSNASNAAATGSRTPPGPPMTPIVPRPLENPRAVEVPRPPEGPIQRPSNPAPDHPRNIGNIPSHPGDREFGLDYYGI